MDINIVQMLDNALKAGGVDAHSTIEDGKSIYSQMGEIEGRINLIMYIIARCDPKVAKELSENLLEPLCQIGLNQRRGRDYSFWADALNKPAVEKTLSDAEHKLNGKQVSAKEMQGVTTVGAVQSISLGSMVEALHRLLH